jgi:lysophospholipase L1-like esterase
MTPGPDVSPAQRPRWQRALIGSLIALCALELGARIFVHGFASQAQRWRLLPLSEVPLERRLYKPHPYTAYALNEKYRSADGLNRHNAQGYRGEEIAVPKPAGTYRILILGGSTTYDTNVQNQRATTCAVLQDMLREHHPEVEVVNAGCGGWTSWESMIDLELRGLSLSPDLVIGYFGTNDVHARLIDPARFVRDNSGFRRPWHDAEHLWEHLLVPRWIASRLSSEYRNSTTDLTELKYKEFDPELCLERNSTAFYSDNLELMAAVCAAHQAQFALATWAWCPDKNDYAAKPYYQQGFEDTNAATRTVAARLGLPLYEHAAEMSRDPGLWADGRHVNDAGARERARLFAAWIEPHFLKGG